MQALLLEVIQQKNILALGNDDHNTKYIDYTAHIRKETMIFYVGGYIYQNYGMYRSRFKISTESFNARPHGVKCNRLINSFNSSP